MLEPESWSKVVLEDTEGGCPQTQRTDRCAAKLYLFAAVTDVSASQEATPEVAGKDRKVDSVVAELERNPA